MNPLPIYVIFVLLACQLSCFSQSDNMKWSPYIFESQSGQKVEAELGEFSVPENRSKPKSRSIDLHFVRFKSTNPNPGNPIVYLAGGPGGSGISTAKGRRFELFMALREVADVIAFDQRGTGLSNQIPNCKSKAEFPLDQPGTAETYISTMSGVAKECITFWKEQGVEVEGYNTRENADDLEELRKALNVPKINLWGISYGSHLAFEFVKRYESSLDKLVLAGLEGPNHTIKLPKYNQNYLRYLQSKVLEDKIAAQVYPDLLGLMEEVLSKLEKQAQLVKVTDPRSGNTFQVGISKLDVQLVASYFLTKNPGNSMRLPYVFHQMKLGNYEEVGQRVAMLKMYVGQVRAMPLVMDAMSGVSEKRWKEIQNQEQDALLGRSTNFPYPDIAFDLKLPDLGAAFRENPKSSVPALFFSGTLDGRTYLESAKELVAGFQHGSHIIIDGAGHDMFMSTPKVTELMLRFFKGQALTSQQIKIDIPEFVVPE